MVRVIKKRDVGQIERDSEWVFLQPRYLTRVDAKQDIFEYIEVFYNRQRLHSTIDYQTPLGYEKENQKMA